MKRFMAALRKYTIPLGVAIVFVTISYVSIASAMLTFTDNGITGNSSMVVDANTLSLGTASATAITIGRSAATTVVGGGMTVMGNATATSLSLTSLGSSSEGCLTVGSNGVVGTTTCASALGAVSTSSPNTWTATQTFNAGITSNATATFSAAPVFSSVLNCNGSSSILQTDASGTVRCGAISGFDQIVESVDALGLNATYTAPSYTVPADGMYRWDAYIEPWQGSGAATTTMNVEYSNLHLPNDYMNYNDSWDGASLPSWDYDSGVFYAKGGTPIIFSVDLQGTLTYDIHYRLLKV